MRTFFEAKSKAQSRFLQDRALLCDLKVFPLCFIQLSNKLVVQLSEFVSVFIDQYVFINFFVVWALFLNQLVSVQKAFWYGRDPHKGLGVGGKQVELTCALKNEDSAVDIVGKLLLDHLC